jgi:hypothetical protein
LNSRPNLLRSILASGSETPYLGILKPGTVLEL